MADQQHTLSSAVAAALQQYQTSPVQPISKPVERVALGTPVQLWNGIEAVVSGWSTCDANRYRLSYFDRHFWQVRHIWRNRSQFEVVPQKQTAEAVASAAA